MLFFQETTDFNMPSSSAVTLGKFDGVHRGHQKLMEKVIHKAQADHLLSCVFALNARTENLLLSPLEQKNVLSDMGIDALVCCPFVPEISGMSPQDFIEEILVRRLHAIYVAVGKDFRFGYKRSGDARFLAEYAAKFGVEVEIIEKETFQGREISSTFIREAVAKGDMPLVHTLMGRYFALHGQVVHGKQLGSTIGFPTANILPPDGKLLPPDGVYFSRVTYNGKSYAGLTDIGCRPTVNGTFRSVETFIYDFHKDVYDREVQIDLLQYERPDHKFASVDELKAQLTRDMAAGERFFASHLPELRK